MTIDALAAALNSEPGFTAETHMRSDDAVYDLIQPSSTIQSTTVVFGLDPITTTGLSIRTEIRLSGPNGSELFKFGLLDDARHLAAVINEAADATGIAASYNGINLMLSSVAVGSGAFIELEVLDEGPDPSVAGVFTRAFGSRVRVAGTDAIPEPASGLLLALVALLRAGTGLRRS